MKGENMNITILICLCLLLGITLISFHLTLKNNNNFVVKQMVIDSVWVENNSFDSQNHHLWFGKTKDGNIIHSKDEIKPGDTFNFLEKTKK